MALPRVALVGLGPHARRIYLPLLQQRGVLQCVVDLVSQRETLDTHVPARSGVARVLLPERARYDMITCDEYLHAVRRAFSREHITHMIIATQPEAHLGYLRLGVDADVRVLVDKPLTVPRVHQAGGLATCVGAAAALEAELDELVALDGREGGERDERIRVMCQRRCHSGYTLLRSLLSAAVQRTRVPVSALQLWHSDGQWNMPCELGRENHPYKLGYGKLLHSGYHLVDLLVFLLGANSARPAAAAATAAAADRVEVQASGVFVRDVLDLYPADVLRELFSSHEMNDDMVQPAFDVDKCGETDVSALVRLLNGQTGRTQTMATLDLQQTGFGQRSSPFWPEDTYKGMGRVRHEQVRAQVGHVLNVQVHSYQARQVRDAPDDPSRSEDARGGLNHFDVDIYRNIGALNGGARHLSFTWSELRHLAATMGERELVQAILDGRTEDLVAVEESDGEDDMGRLLQYGHNETARRDVVTAFLANAPLEALKVKHQRATVRLTRLIYDQLALQFQHQPRPPVQADWPKDELV